MAGGEFLNRPHAKEPLELRAVIPEGGIAPLPDIEQKQPAFVDIAFQRSDARLAQRRKRRIRHPNHRHVRGNRLGWLNLNLPDAQTHRRHQLSRKRLCHRGVRGNPAQGNLGRFRRNSRSQERQVKLVARPNVPRRKGKEIPPHRRCLRKRLGVSGRQGDRQIVIQQNHLSPLSL